MLKTFNKTNNIGSIELLKAKTKERFDRKQNYFLSYIDRHSFLWNGEAFIMTQAISDANPDLSRSTMVKSLAKIKPYRLPTKAVPNIRAGRCWRVKDLIEIIEELTK